MIGIQSITGEISTSDAEEEKRKCKWKYMYGYCERKSYEFFIEILDYLEK